MTTPKTIAFLSDLHAGSWWGLWPRDLLPERGVQTAQARQALAGLPLG